MERLDRALAYDPWLQLFPQTQLFNLEIVYSDHSTLFLNIGINVIRYVPKAFRFENSWLEADDIGHHQAWSSFDSSSIDSMLQFCSEVLMKWGQEKKTMYKEKLRVSKLQMSRFKMKHNPLSVELYRTVQAAYGEVLHQQEIYWQQRSKQLWLRDGDFNIKFFHSKDTARQKKNVFS